MILPFLARTLKNDNFSRGLELPEGRPVGSCALVAGRGSVGEMAEPAVSERHSSHLCHERHPPVCLGNRMNAPGNCLTHGAQNPQADHSYTELFPAVTSKSTSPGKTER